jgi:hypothetical protein
MFAKRQSSIEKVLRETELKIRGQTGSKQLQVICTQNGQRTLTQQASSRPMLYMCP